MVMNGYNFTDRVRRVLAGARGEAIELYHPYVGTEHILLSIAKEGDGVAAAVIENLGGRREEIVDRVLRIVVRGASTARIGPDLPYTSRAKKALELSMSEARIMSENYVNTEHLLLGLIAEERGIGAQVLMSVGLTLDRARHETIRLLNVNAADQRVRPEGINGSAAAGHGRNRVQQNVALLDDFSGRARDALRGAYEEAAARNHSTVELIHLLVALASRDDGMAPVLLDQVVGSRRYVADALVERLPDREARPTALAINLSSETQHALDNALLEASKDGHRRAGTQHILLAVLDVLPLALSAACAQLGLTAKAARAVYEKMRE
jgi:ATP-dependent Clp protease ATP-binding subunit ClpC